MALVTVAVPSLNHGRFIERALQSVLDSGADVECFVMDAGSRDGTREIVERWSPRLAGWRSERDAGQAAAINEGIARGTAPLVAWINSDDAYLPGGLARLVAEIQARPEVSAVYGRAVVMDTEDRRLGRYKTEPFDLDRLARRCFVSQPATLMRREHWDAIGGVDASLHMAFDYDLWWRLAKRAPLAFVDADVAVTRLHLDTKTILAPRRHYREAMDVVRRHYGRVPLIWNLKMPVSIGSRWLASKFHRAPV